QAQAMGGGSSENARAWRTLQLKRYPQGAQWVGPWQGGVGANVRALNGLRLTQGGDLGVGEAELPQHLLGVLAALGRWRRETAWRPAKGHRLSHHLLDAARITRLNLLHDAKVGDLGVSEHLVDGVDGAAGHAGRVEALDPFCAWAVGEVAVDGGVERVAVLEAAPDPWHSADCRAAPARQAPCKGA